MSTVTLNINVSVSYRVNPSRRVIYLCVCMYSYIYMCIHVYRERARERCVWFNIRRFCGAIALVHAHRPGGGRSVARFSFDVICQSRCECARPRLCVCTCYNYIIIMQNALLVALVVARVSSVCERRAADVRGGERGRRRDDDRACLAGAGRSG